MTILSSVRVCGETCEPDETVDIPDADALSLLALGKAKVWIEPTVVVDPPVVKDPPAPKEKA